ncbi:reverse transcriptase domain-containing protein [Tanacetum coccineum]
MTPESFTAMIESAFVKLHHRIVWESHSSHGDYRRHVQTARLVSTLIHEVKFASCTLLEPALTWWNGQIRTLAPDVYSMTWEVLMKKMTDKYYPQGEIKKLEIELWNLKVKGNDVPAYTEP